jgi:hypothetical protein
MGLLFIPQMIYEHGEPWWNYTDKGKQKNSKKNLSQCHFTHHKSPTWTDPVMNLGLQRERLATNPLSHSTAQTCLHNI